MYKTYLSLFVLLFLLGGIGLGIIFLQQMQDLRGRAMELTIPATHATEQTATSLPLNMASYSSDKYGYSVTVDKNLWNAENNLSPGNVTSSTISFHLSPHNGLAEVTLTAHNGAELKALLAKAKSANGKEELDKVASVLQSVPDSSLPANAYFTKSQRIKINGDDAYQFTYEKDVLKTKEYFYSYLFVEDNKYYLITTKYAPSSLTTPLITQFIDGISFTKPGEKVQGASDVAAVNATQLDTTKLTELINPSVVDIVNVTCAKIQITAPEYQSYLKPSYGGFCTGAKGSGFIISKDGYIATNGHVAKIYPKEAFAYALLDAALGDTDNSANKALSPVLVDLYKAAYSAENNTFVTQASAEAELQSFEGRYWALNTLQTLLSQKQLLIQNEKNKYYVKLGNDPIPENEKSLQQADYYHAFSNSRTVQSAQLVAYNYPDNSDAILSGDQQNPKLGDDVALLKLQNDKHYLYPNLQLADISNVKEGNALSIIGYPGLVEGQATSSSLLSFKSSGQSTITQGIVSSIKSDQTGRALIQTDASIDEGNSGGPALDIYGNVLGMATYALFSVSGHYNLIRSNTELKDLLKKENIQYTDSPIYSAWDEGLAYYWNGYYRKALTDFQKVKTAYPIHPTVDSYISHSKEAIAQGKDKEGVWGEIRDKIPLTLLIGLPLALLITGAIGIVIVIIKRKRHLIAQAQQAVTMQQLMDQHIPIT